MARVGKIARLPQHIRIKLNRHLQDGELGNRLVEWLNSLPEVQSVLAAEFDGRPMNEQNLSEWKQGGFKDWERHEEACERVRRLTEQAEDFNIEADEIEVSDRLAPVLAAELAGLAESLLAETSEPREQWRRLRELLRELAQLRREDHREARLRIEQQRWGNESERLEKEERSREIRKAKDKACAPITAARRLPLVAEGFGGGEAGREIAAFVLELEFDLPPGSLNRKVQSSQIKPNQT